MINLLSGKIDELAPQFFSHMEIQSICFAKLNKNLLAAGKIEAANHLKRVSQTGRQTVSLYLKRPLITKTYWHPIGK